MEKIELDISILKGKILQNVENVEDEKIVFTVCDGEKYELCHIREREIER